MQSADVVIYNTGEIELKIPLNENDIWLGANDIELELDIKKHNSGYPKITLKKFDASHDRFLIKGAKELYNVPTKTNHLIQPMLF